MTPSGSFKQALIITRLYLYPRNGGAFLYSSQLTRMVASFSKTVDVLCKDRGLDLDPRPHLRKSFPRNVSFHITPSDSPRVNRTPSARYPHPLFNFDTQDNHRELERLLRKDPDVIFIDHIASCWALPFLEDYKARRPNATVIYVTHNMERDVRLSMAKSAFFEFNKAFRRAVRSYFFMKPIERKAFSLADVVTHISSRDKKRYEDVYGVPNAIVLNPIYEGPVVEKRTIDETVPRRVCVVGSFEWDVKMKNTLKLLQTMAGPFHERGIELQLIGRMKPDFEEAIKTGWPRVLVSANVPDVYALMRNCRAGLIAEELGGGFKLKSLDYIFNRLPLFTLDGAVADVPLDHGQNAFVAKNFGELRDGVIAAVNDFAFLNRLQNNAVADAAHFLAFEARRDSLVQALRKNVTALGRAA